jgi:DNA-binding NtrC family response regulator
MTRPFRVSQTPVRERFAIPLSLPSRGNRCYTCLPPAPAMEAPPNPPSVLIVDDDTMVLATLTVTLATEPYEVVACSSPIQALTLLPNRDFAVIISDQRMPKMLGLDFLVECRRLRPRASRILLTAVLDLTTAMDAINRGQICRFIAKPWLGAELVSAIRDAIQRHALATHHAALEAETMRLSEQLTKANRALESQQRELEQERARYAAAAEAGR